jgi:hypothetical protein
MTPERPPPIIKMSKTFLRYLLRALLASGFSMMNGDDVHQSIYLSVAASFVRAYCENCDISIFVIRGSLEDPPKEFVGTPTDLKPLPAQAISNLSNKGGGMIGIQSPYS